MTEQPPIALAVNRDENAAMLDLPMAPHTIVHKNHTIRDTAASLDAEHRILPPGWSCIMQVIEFETVSKRSSKWEIATLMFQSHVMTKVWRHIR